MGSISDNNKRIAKNSIFLSIRMVIVLVITLYTTRCVLQILGVENFGIYNVVCGFVSMFAFLNTSMSNGIQRFYSFELGKNGEKGANTVYNTAIIIQLLLAITFIILAESIGIWYINYKMVIPAERLIAANWIFQLALIGFLFIVMQVPYTAAVMAHERMDFFAIVSVLDAVFKLTIALCIPLFSGDRLIVYGILMTLINILNFILYLSYSKRFFAEITWQKKFYKGLFKSMLGFSGWNVFGSFSGMMKEQGINLVMNLFFGPVVNAARGIAVQVNAGIQSFVSSLSTPIRPQIVKSYAMGDVSRCIKLTYSMSKISCFFLYLIALPIIYNINWVLKIWLGDDVPEYTNIFVVVVVLISFLNNLNASASCIVHATGKMKLYQLSTSIIALLSIPLSYFALKNGLPAVTALWMVFITMILVQIAAVYVLNILINISPKDYLRKVISPIMKVIILTSWIPYILFIIEINEGLRFILTTIISIIIGGVIIYYIGLDKQEKIIINNFINKKK